MRLQPKRYPGDPWPSILWPTRRARGRPTVAERDLRRDLARTQRERIARGLVTVLVWEYDGAMYCHSGCIIRQTEVWTQPWDEWSSQGWEFTDSWTGQQHIPLFPVRNYNVYHVRQQFKKGHWPMMRYKTYRHFAADVDHMRCCQCGQPFRPAMPATKHTQRLKSQWRKSRKRRQIDRDRAYRASRKPAAASTATAS